MRDHGRGRTEIRLSSPEAFMPLENSNLVVRGYVTLHVPCRYSYLRIIRQSVMDLSARSGLSEFKAAQMEMACDEACANIIEHSYGGETSDAEERHHPGIRLNLMQCADRVIVEILDRGKGFSFEEQDVIEPKTYVENQNRRGLGMYIIKSFVDDVAYEPQTRAGNCLRLTKMLR
jgi:anti-sigma regulatory factor (Ser/Thr protein kinase)